MIALYYGSNVPGNTWNLPEGMTMIGQNQISPENLICGRLQNFFYQMIWTSWENTILLDVPMMEVDEEVCN
jgi:hypothetical protein